MIIFYHSADLDGHCSGAVAKKYAKIVSFEGRITMYGINYGDKFPWHLVSSGEHVIMLDFSLQPFDDMIKLNTIVDSFVWIDHHISAIKEHDKFKNVIKGVRNTEKAACELAWEYFFEDKTIPESVYLLGRYDVWDHKDAKTLPFQYGMRLYDTDPSGNFNWDKMFYSFPHNILNEGETILKYVDQDNKKYAKFCAFETSIAGLKGIAINRMLASTKMFESVWDETKYDVMIAFGFRNGLWTISLYTTKDGIDVSETAKIFGGGGHKQVAGFQCGKLPFVWKNKNGNTSSN